MDRRAGMTLSPAQRGEIIGLIESDKTVSQVATEKNISRRTIYNWLKRRREGDSSLESKPRSGRPRCTTREQDEALVQAIRDRPLLIGGVAEIRRNLNLNCNYSTVGLRVKEAGIGHYKPAKKPNITDNHRQARIEFARSFSEMNQSYWDLVVFSDEKTFRSNTTGRLELWRPRNTR
jgi:transposase